MAKKKIVPRKAQKKLKNKLATWIIVVIIHTRNVSLYILELIDLVSGASNLAGMASLEVN